ncbi:chitinase-like protein Idgf5 isoform X1 [Drosophila grimshawi]|uniref:chitinase-like protein Idgf5 isoform X1 n=1 Tax=Drosophila grimshawi TaxID=7222 RepID=UPI000C87141E|nr:chitinase-like protein Idgf5 isoform X1 [Drosophila grimshawi]
MLPSGGVFLGVLLCLCCSWHVSQADVAKLVCFYDTSSFVREGESEMSSNLTLQTLHNYRSVNWSRL